MDPAPLDVDAVLLDIDGVLAVSWQAIEGAPEACASLRAANMPVRFVTNTTSRSRASIAEALCDIGIEVDDDEILTATRATAAYVQANHPGRSCLLVSSGDASDDLAGCPLVTEPDRADVVIIGGAGPEFDYETLNGAFRAVQGGAALVAMHRNLHWRTADGDQLDTGAFLMGLEAATLVDAVVVGKPSPEFFEVALASAGVEPTRAVMVGDDVDSDILGAQRLGIHGVLVRTGKFRPADVAASASAGRGTPDRIIDSVADLPALLTPVD